MYRENYANRNGTHTHSLARIARNEQTNEPTKQPSERTNGRKGKGS